jgi:hypothetical protein
MSDVLTRYEEFWRTRDVDRWMDALAPEVVLHSPLLSAPFVGRALARDLFTVLAAELESVVITERFTGPTGDAFAWEATASGRSLAGIDIVRTDVAGDIREVVVAMRPLAGLASFAAAVCGPMAALRRPRWRVMAAASGAALLPIAGLSDRFGRAVLGVGEDEALLRSDRTGGRIG